MNMLLNKSCNLGVKIRGHEISHTCFKGALTLQYGLLEKCIFLVEICNDWLGRSHVLDNKNCPFVVSCFLTKHAATQYWSLFFLGLYRVEWHAYLKTCTSGELALWWLIQHQFIVWNRNRNHLDSNKNNNLIFTWYSSNIAHNMKGENHIVGTFPKFQKKNHKQIYTPDT